MLDQCIPIWLGKKNHKKWFNNPIDLISNLLLISILIHFFFQLYDFLWCIYHHHKTSVKRIPLNEKVQIAICNPFFNALAFQVFINFGTQSTRCLFQPIHGLEQPRYIHYFLLWFPQTLMDIASGHFQWIPRSRKSSSYIKLKTSHSLSPIISCYVL